MDRSQHLATIQQIKKIDPIPNAERVELIHILLWKLVAQKGVFKEGDFLIYIEVNALCPNTPLYADVYKYSNGKVRTAKLCGVYSQGFPLPLSALPQSLSPAEIEIYREDNPSISLIETDGRASIPIQVGVDVSRLLGITKYQMPIAPDMVDIILNSLPAFFFRTDEPRLESHPHLLQQYTRTPFYISEKIDGQSSSFYYNRGHFGVGARGVEFKDHPKVVQWQIAHQLKLPEKMQYLGKNIVLQGELLGEGIQGNKYKLKGHLIKFFTAFDIDRTEYLSYFDFKKLIIEDLGLSDRLIVPIIREKFYLPAPIDELEALVETENGGKSRINPNTRREGFVIRAVNETSDSIIGRLSFKLISKSFLVKHKE